MVVNSSFNLDQVEFYIVETDNGVTLPSARLIQGVICRFGHLAYLMPRRCGFPKACISV